MPAATTSVSASDVHDPASSAYKKARKRYLKSLRNRNDQVEPDWTPFRAAEKRYKARFPPPDLTNVLDLATLDASRTGEISRGGWRGRGDTVRYREIDLKLQERTSSDRKAYVFPDTPGLVLLPAFIEPAEQRRLMRWALCEQARHPNETNLDTHYILPEEGLWNKYLEVQRGLSEDENVQPRASTSGAATETLAEPPGPRKLVANEPAGKVNFSAISAEPKLPPAPSPSVHSLPVSALVPKLRWANIGWSYHWGTKQYDFSKGKGTINEEVKRVWKRAVKSVRWEEVFADGSSGGDWGEEAPDWDTWNEGYEPDAGIVNFYQTKACSYSPSTPTNMVMISILQDTLMAHVDRSEVCATSPLVSISLGCAAIFLIGGLTRDVEPMPIVLRSGDVVIMSGPACRRAYHGVPRILEGTLPPHFETRPDDEQNDWKVHEEYLRSTRININVRQVFPRGFDPPREIPSSS
ncbi:uncharacterized protein LAESUDRAFT_784182 [Laetiporus sulphureus 93-53]|uniref:Fe2OG dioxygenase domain-containing protein n=1 Tax=Laetiporus sulphureus 93-53 TaxID=1314785 RepID=A0A165HEC2_9APHY|nr:uncharacterized protein LAESUDRAFT_784182 [Laetiporus sulphureus 93-53]KZT11624.1 hypothetical protein LAESUDRAFT_784182 [Laetiporus sulphureus 93-53]